MLKFSDVTKRRQTFWKIGSFYFQTTHELTMSIWGIFNGILQPVKEETLALWKPNKKRNLNSV